MFSRGKKLSWAFPFWQKAVAKCFSVFLVEFFSSRKQAVLEKLGIKPQTWRCPRYCFVFLPKEMVMTFFPILNPWAMFSLFLLHLLLFFPHAFFHSSLWCAWSEWYTQVWLDVLSPLHVSTAVRDWPFLPRSWWDTSCAFLGHSPSLLTCEWGG